LFLESNPIPVKKALELMGKIGSGIRPPLCPLDPVHYDKLREAMIIGKVI
jgi:4-hydroxy-tetrahydrodipicolinate synthase